MSGQSPGIRDAPGQTPTTGPGLHEGPNVPSPVHAGDVQELMLSLVDKSLVLREEGAGGPRYRLLETVRQYARERLQEAGESAGARNRHLEYYLRLATQADPELRGSEPEVWLDRLEVEHDNFRAALDWCQANSDLAAAGIELTSALWRFWDIRGYLSQGREQLAAALARGPHVRTLARARALNGAGLLTLQQGELAPARELFQDTLGTCARAR